MGLLSKVLDAVLKAEQALENRKNANAGDASKKGDKPKHTMADVPEPLVPNDPFGPKKPKPAEAAAVDEVAAPAKKEEDLPLGDVSVPAQLYGRDQDPWTGRVKLLLRDRQVDFSYVDLDLPEHTLLAARLVRETKQAEGPYVYLRGEFVGGYNGISELERLGQLDDRLLPVDQRSKVVGGVRIIVPPRGPEGGPPAGGLRDGLHGGLHGGLGRT